MKTKLLLFGIFCCTIINAQTYDFNITNGNYTDLIGSISLNNGQIWDDPNYTIPIGFNFKYFDTIVDQIHINDWGYGGLLTMKLNDVGKQYILSPYGTDIIDRGEADTIQPTSQSNISYLQEGTIGNRILKIEWNNVGFYGEVDDLETANDFTNFQMWLHEGSNLIEVHFGPKSILNPTLAFEGETGPSLLLSHSYDFDNDSILKTTYLLSGPPLAANMIQTIYSDSIEGIFLDGIIPNGTIYQFTLNEISTAGIGKEKNLEIGFTISPNPASDFITVTNSSKQIDIVQANIINIAGKTVKTVKAIETIDISTLPTSLYILKIKTKDGQSKSMKWVKQ